MSPEHGKAFRLRPAAQLDLEAIWSFTAARWSVAQADEYITGMTRAFELIADNPKLARERNEFTPPVRIRHYESHLIIYIVGGDGVDILRIRHRSEDWAADANA